MADDIRQDIRIHERLAKLEQAIEAMKQLIEMQHEDDQELAKIQREDNLRLEKKVDQILHNDKDKIEKINNVQGEVIRVKETVKNIKAILWVFLVPLAAGIARWFI